MVSCLYLPFAGSGLLILDSQGLPGDGSAFWLLSPMKEGFLMVVLYDILGHICLVALPACTLVLFMGRFVMSQLP